MANPKNRNKVDLYAMMLRDIRLPALGLETEFSVEDEKVGLGIDEMIFHLAASAGRQVSRKEVGAEIDQAIVQALEGLSE
jgi:microcompartment protein CcmK/EutM